jgi:hypothetical protein
MDTLTTIIQELITLLGSTNLATDLATVGQIATHLLSLLGDKNAQRDLQSEDAYKAAQLGSVTAAQWLYHNSQGNGMPHEDVVRGQFYWSELAAAGWTVNTSGNVVPPAAPAPPAPPVQ